MINDKSCRSFFFLLGTCIEIDAFTHNHIPSKAVIKILYEIWTGKCLKMSFIKLQGYEAYVRCQVSEKLEPKSEKCYFLDYPKETKRYYFYNPSQGKVFVVKTSIFLEREFMSKGISGEKVELKEI